MKTIEQLEALSIPELEFELTDAHAGVEKVLAYKKTVHDVLDRKESDAAIIQKMGSLTPQEKVRAAQILSGSNLPKIGDANSGG